jgi:uncharacterized protein (UPF0548 family)
LTYPEVGATRDDRLPAGYGHVRRAATIGSGPSVFQRAADAVLSWDMHRAAGLRVPAGTGPAAPGVEVRLRAGPFTIPCRVVYTIDDAACRGFAYGTLPGHPERGEEAFLVTLADDGEVRFHVRAFSRHATFLARCGGPATSMVQRYVTTRYVTAVRRLALLPR